MNRVLPLALLLLAGCSKPEAATYPVEGLAIINGTPLEGFTVEFTSLAEATKGMSARGTIGADGKFTLKTMVNDKEKEGAIAGPHKVVVVPPPSGFGPKVIAQVPNKYSDYNTTPLTFEVKAEGGNKYTIPLTR